METFVLLRFKDRSKSTFISIFNRNKKANNVTDRHQLSTTHTLYIYIRIVERNKSFDDSISSICLCILISFNQTHSASYQ